MRRSVCGGPSSSFGQEAFCSGKRRKLWALLTRLLLLICFVDGKSTKARTGILVHFTAPTIHAGWHGNIVLEIANLGPFTFVLQEDVVVAQVTVATISSIPERTQKEAGSQTLDQANVRGQPAKP